jgi:uncharacterized membrane protein YkvA (DUF1232 family)
MDIPSGISEAQGEAALERATKGVNRNTIRELLEEQASIESKLHGVLEQFYQDVCCMFRLLRAWWGNQYELPWSSVAVIAGALVYVHSPIDFIPDVIPVLGLTDDAMVVWLALRKVRGDLDRFRAWEEARGSAGAV